MISLVMRRGPSPEKVFSLTGDEITIGRGVKNQIVIDDNDVSREHCRLVRHDADYEVHDLNSTDGTFVNGQRVRAPILLNRGAVIELGGSITLEYGVSESQIMQVPDYIRRLMPNGVTPAFGDSDDSAVPARYCLMMLQGPAVGYIYTIEGETIRIGRDLANDVVIQDPEVSRFHIRLAQTKNGYVVEDLNSTNGSFVNNIALKETRLFNGNDILRLGSLVQLLLLRVEASESIEEAAARAMPKYNGGDTTIDALSLDTIASRPDVPTGIPVGSLGESLMLVYAREDWQTTIAPLLVSLQDGGLNVWVDQYLVPGTNEWRASVTQALSETWLMIFVVSPRSLESAPVRSMYLRFLRERKPVIVFIADNHHALPAELSRIRSIGFDALNPSRSYHKLIFEIRQFWRQRT